jgi:hypothetical protein
MNPGFKKRWEDERLTIELDRVVLQPRLRVLIGAPFSSAHTDDGGLVLSPLAVDSTGPEFFPDRTGYEAFANKLHIEDYLDGDEANEPSELFRQGTKAAMELSRRLESKGAYRVMLSFDPDLPTMTLRFFKRRNELWGPEDAETYVIEDLLIIDVGPPSEPEGA